MTARKTLTHALTVALLMVIGGPGCRETSTSRRRASVRREPAATRSTPSSAGRGGTGAARPGRVRTVLIQVDGLAAGWVDRWLRERRFLPGSKPATPATMAAGGLARLAAAGGRAEALVPVDPTVTASNLATMLTGALPARHGILSNRFYRRGQRVNGFAEPLDAETLWQAAPRQGLRTVTWAALGTRCQEAPHALLRTACWATRSWLGRPQSGVVLTLAPGGTGTLTLRAGRRAPGRPSLALGVRRTATGIALVPPAGVVLRGGPDQLGVGETREVLWSGGALDTGGAAPRRLTRVELHAWSRRTGRATFHIGGTAINIARPAAFHRTLDRAGVIRPPMADELGFRKGRLDAPAFLRSALAEVDAAVALARLLGRGDTFDLAILYLGAVDSLGHQLLAGRGRAELAPDEVIRFRAALERGLRAVDHGLALLLDALDLRRTRVVLASDHGMAPTLHDVSLRAALAPVDRRIRVITSGGAGFVHLPPGVDPEAVERRLAALRVAGRLVFASGRVVRANGLAALGLGAGAADLFVQAGPGFTLSHRRSRKLAGWPGDQADHGLRSDLPAMHGVFLAAGPGASRRSLGRLHMTQVAAAVAAAAGMDPPRHARPGPKGLWRRAAPGRTPTPGR